MVKVLDLETTDGKRLLLPVGSIAAVQEWVPRLESEGHRPCSMIWIHGSLFYVLASVEDLVAAMGPRLVPVRSEVVPRELASLEGEPVEVVAG